MVFFFFFQAEDGIRDKLVTGVQTCALPISSEENGRTVRSGGPFRASFLRGRPALRDDRGHGGGPPGGRQYGGGDPGGRRGGGDRERVGEGKKGGFGGGRIIKKKKKTKKVEM